MQYEYRPYKLPQDYPPVNYNHHPYPYYTTHQNQSWNIPEIAQTPYEIFAKPELPEQWPNEPKINPTSMADNGNGLGTSGNFGAAGPAGGLAGNPSGGPASYFYNNNGQIDFDKVLSTVGQLASTYHQVTPIVKQFSSLIKNFR
ncbi:YppG family protein [Oceanobacillus damuensis]|uniref:YppG family protein n=1 Tax=Oceanobacillus damuensis TaxID=937928 RepID=UPI00082FC807|nr:YppG family protein [Oceanobacillus damuensis]